MVAEAEAHRAEDEEVRKKAEARSSLETYLFRWVAGWVTQG